MESWILYLLECSDKSLYCGITNNLDKRLKLHNSGKASRYTRARLPVKLVAIKKNLSRSQALRLELEIKKLPKDKKMIALNKQ